MTMELTRMIKTFGKTLLAVTLAGMVAVLVGVSLWSDWRDGVRA